MIDKDPSGIEIMSIFWGIFLAMSGGLVSFIKALNESKEVKSLKMIILKLLGHLLTSGFAGLMTLYFCQYLSLDMKLTAVLIGISGHMGGLAIDELKKFWYVYIKPSKK